MDFSEQPFPRICCSSCPLTVRNEEGRGELLIFYFFTKHFKNCMSQGLFYKITSRLVISPKIKIRNLDVVSHLIKTDRSIFLFSCYSFVLFLCILLRLFSSVYVLKIKKICVVVYNIFFINKVITSV